LNQKLENDKKGKREKKKFISLKIFSYFQYKNEIEIFRIFFFCFIFGEGEKKLFTPTAHLILARGNGSHVIFV